MRGSAWADCHSLATRGIIRPKATSSSKRADTLEPRGPPREATRGPENQQEPPKEAETHIVVSTAAEGESNSNLAGGSTGNQGKTAEEVMSNLASNVGFIPVRSEIDILSHLHACATESVQAASLMQNYTRESMSTAREEKRKNDDKLLNRELGNELISQVHLEEGTMEQTVVRHSTAVVHGETKLDIVGKVIENQNKPPDKNLLMSVSDRDGDETLKGISNTEPSSEDIMEEAMRSSTEAEGGNTAAENVFFPRFIREATSSFDEIGNEKPVLEGNLPNPESSNSGELSEGVFNEEAASLCFETVGCKHVPKETAVAAVQQKQTQSSGDASNFKRNACNEMPSEFVLNYWFKSQNQNVTDVRDALLILTEGNYVWGDKQNEVHNMKRVLKAARADILSASTDNGGTNPEQRINVPPFMQEGYSGDRVDLDKILVSKKDLKNIRKELRQLAEAKLHAAAAVLPPYYWSLRKCQTKKQRKKLLKQQKMQAALQQKLEDTDKMLKDDLNNESVQKAATNVKDINNVVDSVFCPRPSNEVMACVSEIRRIDSRLLYGLKSKESGNVSKGDSARAIFPVSSSESVKCVQIHEETTNVEVSQPTEFSSNALCKISCEVSSDGGERLVNTNKFSLATKQQTDEDLKADAPKCTATVDITQEPENDFETREVSKCVRFVRTADTSTVEVAPTDSYLSCKTADNQTIVGNGDKSINVSNGSGGISENESGAQIVSNSCWQTSEQEQAQSNTNLIGETVRNLTPAINESESSQVNVSGGISENESDLEVVFNSCWQTAQQKLVPNKTVIADDNLGELHVSGEQRNAGKTESSGCYFTRSKVNQAKSVRREAKTVCEWLKSQLESSEQLLMGGSTEDLSHSSKNQRRKFKKLRQDSLNAGVFIQDKKLKVRKEQRGQSQKLRDCLPSINDATENKSMPFEDGEGTNMCVASTELGNVSNLAGVTARNTTKSPCTDNVELSDHQGSDSVGKEDDSDLEIIFDSHQVEPECIEIIDDTDTNEGPEINAGAGAMADNGATTLVDAGVTAVSGYDVSTMLDAGVRAVSDAGASTMEDAGVRAVPDAGVSTMEDAGVRAVPDAGVSTMGDAGVRAVTDAGVSTMGDAGVRAVSDAGVSTMGDAGVRAVSDAGASSMGDAGVRAVLDAGSSTTSEGLKKSHMPSSHNVKSHITHKSNRMDITVGISHLSKKRIRKEQRRQLNQSKAAAKRAQRIANGEVILTKSQKRILNSVLFSVGIQRGSLTMKQNIELRPVQAEIAAGNTDVRNSEVLRHFVTVVCGKVFRPAGAVKGNPTMGLLSNRNTCAGTANTLSSEVRCLTENAVNLTKVKHKIGNKVICREKPVIENSASSSQAKHSLKSSAGSSQAKRQIENCAGSSQAKRSIENSARAPQVKCTISGTIKPLQGKHLSATEKRVSKIQKGYQKWVPSSEPVINKTPDEDCARNGTVFANKDTPQIANITPSEPTEEAENSKCLTQFLDHQMSIQNALQKVETKFVVRVPVFKSPDEELEFMAANIKRTVNDSIFKGPDGLDLPTDSEPFSQRLHVWEAASHLPPAKRYKVAETELLCSDTLRNRTRYCPTYQTHFSESDKLGPCDIRYTGDSESSPSCSQSTLIGNSFRDHSGEPQITADCSLGAREPLIVCRIPILADEQFSAGEVPTYESDSGLSNEVRYQPLGALYTVRNALDLPGTGETRPSSLESHGRSGSFVSPAGSHRSSSFESKERLWKSKGPHKSRESPRRSGSPNWSRGGHSRSGSPNWSRGGHSRSGSPNWSRGGHHRSRSPNWFRGGHHRSRSPNCFRGGHHRNTSPNWTRGGPHRSRSPHRHRENSYANRNPQRYEERFHRTRSPYRSHREPYGNEISIELGENSVRRRSPQRTRDRDRRAD